MDMIEKARLLLEQHRPGYSLPQPFYTDPDIHRFDLAAVFERSWAMVGFECELERPGSYIATTIGSSPVVVLRNKKEEIVGFHNVCRHRGAQICPNGTGRAPRLVCPYHQWTYDQTGKLIGTSGTQPPADAGNLDLRPIKVEAVGGCIYATLADDPPEFAPFRKVLEPALKHQNLNDCKVAYRNILHEKANWKLVMENGRECYHCPGAHPEYNKVFPTLKVTDKGLASDTAIEAFEERMKELQLDVPAQAGDWWQVGRLPMRAGFASHQVDGKPNVGKSLCDLNGGEIGSLRWATEPNNFCHATSDSAMSFNCLPIDALNCIVHTTWLVHRDAVEGEDYTIEGLTHFWDQTNRQDRALAENAQLGVNGSGYLPGPYSPEEEPYLIAFGDFYARMAKAYVDERSASTVETMKKPA